MSIAGVINVVNLLVATYSVTDQVYMRINKHPLFRGDVKEAWDKMDAAGKSYNTTAAQLQNASVLAANYRSGFSDLLSLFSTIQTKQEQLSELSMVLADAMKAYQNTGIRRLPDSILFSEQFYKSFLERRHAEGEFAAVQIVDAIFYPSIGLNVASIGISIWQLRQDWRQSRSTGRPSIEPAQSSSSRVGVSLQNALPALEFSPGASPRSSVSSSESMIVGSPPDARREAARRLLLQSSEIEITISRSSSGRISQLNLSSELPVEVNSPERSRRVSVVENVVLNEPLLAGGQARSSLNAARAIPPSTSRWAVAGTVIGGLNIGLAITAEILMHAAMTDMKKTFDNETARFNLANQITTIILDGTGDQTSAEGAKNLEKVERFFKDLLEAETVKSSSNEADNLRGFLADMKQDAVKSYLRDGLRDSTTTVDTNINTLINILADLLISIRSSAVNYALTVNKEISSAKQSRDPNSERYLSWLDKVADEVARTDGVINNQIGLIAASFTAESTAARAGRGADRLVAISNICRQVGEIVTERMNKLLQEMKTNLEDVTSVIRVSTLVRDQFMNTLDTWSNAMTQFQHRSMTLDDTVSARPTLDSFLTKSWPGIFQTIQKELPMQTHFTSAMSSDQKAEVAVLFEQAWEAAVKQHFASKS